MHRTSAAPATDKLAPRAPLSLLSDEEAPSVTMDDAGDSDDVFDYAPGRLIADPPEEAPPASPELCPLITGAAAPSHETSAAEPQPQAPQKPADMSWGDWMLTPDRPLNHRHETLAHMAAAGMSNAQIARDLGLTPSRVSVLLSNTKIKDRMNLIRDKYWGANITQRFQHAVPRAMDVVDEILAPDTPQSPNKHRPQLRAQTATWVLEKVTGKAVQSINHSGNLIGQLIDQLDARSAGHRPGVDNASAPGATSPIIDVSPAPPEPQAEEPKDPLAAFVAEYVPTGTRVGKKTEVPSE